MTLIAYPFVWLFFVLSISSAATFTNPIRGSGADPFLVWDNGYWYLLTTSTPIRMVRATTIAGLNEGESKVVWSDDNPTRNKQMFAPEIHHIGEVWYLYYTATSDDDVDQNHRNYVLEGGSSPWDTYTFAGQLGDTWGIDSSILSLNNAQYLVWCCKADGLTGTQSLCIGSLSSPTALENRRILSVPSEAWETSGFPVNEAPSAVYRDGRTFLSFSASACSTPEYSVGLLAYDGGDPLDRNSWIKSGPHFTSGNGNYGTGHNGFVLNPGTTEDWWNVYHATANSSGACDGSRYTMFQKLNWNADGSPDFGEPVERGTTLQGPSGEPSEVL